MKYIVLDLEFNQPFNFKTGKQTILNPECPFEIIQIGAVKLDEYFNTIDKFNFLIKPKIYKRIHPYVEKITNITSSMLYDKLSFQDTYKLFIKFCENTDNILCTWGIDDIKFLYKNILYYNLDVYAISNKYINIQNLATKYLNYEIGNNIGLKNAVNELNIKIENSFHNALNDADYTAKVFKIVCPKDLSVETFDITEFTKKNKKKLNTKKLIAIFEQELKRKLTKEEIYLIKKAYKLGQYNKITNK